MTMNERTLDLLDFRRVRDDVAGYCRSDEGRTSVLESLPEPDPGRVEDAKARSRAIGALFEEGLPLPGGTFPPIAGFLPVLSKEGTCLEQEELYALALWSEAYGELKTFLAKAEHPVLAGEASEAPDLGEVPRIVFRVLARDGTLADLPELRDAQSRIRKVNSEIERITSSFFQDGDLRSMLQSDLPTQRDGRTVLAVRANFKAKIRGIVHEVSDTGRTVFIEPEALVRKNNELVEAEAKYRQEVFRILKETTAKVAVRLEDIEAARAACAAFDDLWARARYSHLSRGTFALPGSAGLALRKARHPMLGSKAVPIDLEIPEEVRTLVITGPNTGGKTVSLKTVGLLALVNQFGMEIPAGEGSRLAVFDSVRADIGDEQSIEQSLSTFSAHVKNLAAIVQGITDRSLVLLDELGAGTDPQEGVALAMALLDRFLETGCIVLATTHHGILKNYGATRAGVQNASMGFDSESLAPTYRVLMGVPGESHALEIARRTGMPPDVMDSAEAYLRDERTDISRLVANLSQRHRRLAEAEEEHRARETVLREKWRRTDLKELSLRQKELELRRHGLKDLRDFLQEARRQWDALRERQGSDPAAGKEFGALASAIRERIGREQDRVARDQEAMLPAVDFEIREGMEVLVRRSGRRGRVLRRDRGKRWLVETETLRLSLLPGELAPAGPAGAGERSTAAVSYSAPVQVDPPVLELHLLGMRAEEAVRALERQVDSALVFGLREFSVVHGKGEGILRTVIHERLRAMPVVEGFRFSAPEEGGHGKTVVTLRA